MARSKKAQAAIEDALSINGPSGQVGLGVDLVEIDRMRAILKRTRRFRERIFTPLEIEYCEGHADPAIHFAARFAAKEAAVKALGTGFADGIGYADVEVTNNAKGRPVLMLHRKAAEKAEEMGVTDTPLSISHTDNDAVACVIAITKDSTAEAEKRIDPAAELAKQFKETRGMLDELDAKGISPSDIGAELEAEEQEAEAIEADALEAAAMEEQGE